MRPCVVLEDPQADELPRQLVGLRRAVAARDADQREQPRLHLRDDRLPRHAHAGRAHALHDGAQG